MTDREKVVGHLYDCLAASKPENMWVFVRKGIVGDVLALLKEQEDVVRCKDCTHTEHCEIYAGWDGKHPDWFCADGERRQA